MVVYRFFIGAMWLFYGSIYSLVLLYMAKTVHSSESGLLFPPETPARYLLNKEARILIGGYHGKEQTRQWDHVKTDKVPNPAYIRDYFLRCAILLGFDIHYPSRKI